MRVVDLSAERDRRASEAWDRYIAAKALAEETLLFQDGQAAALAWRSFLDLYLSPTQSASLSCDVVQMGRRA